MANESPELLLEHGSFLRALAGALLHSRGDADDIVQGTYAVALTKAPPRGWPLPQWLAGVARNLARRSERDRRRRTAREAEVAAALELRSPADLVEQEELRQRVVAAVLGLAEPVRTIVLLRYYDGLSPRAIGERLGMPGATVRSHLHRAVTALRHQLDRDQREGRPAWTVLLRSIVGPTATAAASARSGLLAKVGAAAAAVGGVLWLASGSDPAPGMVRAERAPLHTAAVEPVGAEAVVRAAVPAAGEPVAPAARAEPQVVLRFLGTDGSPVVGEPLRQRFADARTEPTAVVLEAGTLRRGGLEGLAGARFGDASKWQSARSLEFTGEGATVVLGREEREVFLLVARPHAPAFLSPALRLPLARAITLDVPLASAGSLRTVRFVAADGGAPLAAATVRACTEFGDDLAFVPGTTVVADARGECRLASDRLPHAMVLRPAVWWVETPTHAARLSARDLAEGKEVRVPRRGRLEGRGFDKDGVPAAAREVLFAADKGPVWRTRAAPDGSFVLADLPPVHGIVVLLAAASSDCNDLVSVEAMVETAATKTVQLGSATPRGSVSGRVTSGGLPLPGVIVLVMNGPDGRRIAKTDADGRYAVRGIVGSCRFVVLLGDPNVSDDFGISRTEPLAAEPGREQVLDLDLPRGVLRVRVVDDGTGEPVAGVDVEARPKDGAAQRDRFPACTFRAGWAERTGADGTVLLRCLPEGEAHHLRIGGKGVAVVERTVDAPLLDLSPEPIVVRVRRQ